VSFGVTSGVVRSRSSHLSALIVSSPFGGLV
jgi:hypothetical protein